MAAPPVTTTLFQGVRLAEARYAPAEDHARKFLFKLQVQRDLAWA